MSRRSLRIEGSFLDRGLPHSTASFNVGGATAGRKSRVVSSRRLSASCSESLLLHTPHKQTPHSGSSQMSGSQMSGSQMNGSQMNTSGVLPVDASDTSLVSSLLDESRILESTTIEGFWGLDLDAVSKDLQRLGEFGEEYEVSGSTVLCQSTVLADNTVIGPYTSCSGPLCSLIGQEPVSLEHSRGRCDKDLETFDYPGPVGPKTGLGSGPRNPEDTPTIYCRRRRHKGQSSTVAMKEPSVRDELIHGALCADCQERPLRDTAVSLLLSLMGALWSIAVFTGGAAARGFSWSRRRWSQTNKGQNTRFPLGFLLLLALLLGLCFTALWCGLPSAWVSQVLPPPQSQSTGPDPGPEHKPDPGPDPSSTVQTNEEPQSKEPTMWKEPPEITQKEKLSDLESFRLERLEQSLSSLWKLMIARGLNSDPDLDLARNRLELNNGVWDQEPHSLSLRLKRIELELEEIRRRPGDLEENGAAALELHSAPQSKGSGAESPDVSHTELSHIQGALQSLRQELQLLSDCRGTCPQMDLQDTVSTLVQEQVWTLIFGGEVGSGLDSTKPLVQVLSEQFVSESRFQGALSALEQKVSEQQTKKLPVRGGVTRQEVRIMVQSALRKFSEDQTGLADFALESGGGSMVNSRCSESFKSRTALLSLFGFPLMFFTQSPRAVIQPDVLPGNCWPFRGSVGQFVIRLSAWVFPLGFSLEHLPRSLSHDGSRQSAPRDFSVYGLGTEDEEEGSLLGTYVYDEDGDALQTFALTEENDKSFHFVLVKVLSNWGHKEYTCVYRFRVHGSRAGTEDGSGTETMTEDGSGTETMTEDKTETWIDDGAEDGTRAETSAEGGTGAEVGTKARTRTNDEAEVEETEPVTGEEEQTGTVTEEEEQPGTVTGEEEQTGTVTEEEEQPGTVTGEEEQTGTVTGEEEQTGTVTGEEEQTGTVKGAEGETGAVTGAEEETGTVTGAEEETGTVTGAEEETGTVTGAEEETGTVTGAEEETGTVTGAEEETGTVTGAEEETGTVTGAEEETGTEETGTVMGDEEQTGTVMGDEEETVTGAEGEAETMTQTENEAEVKADMVLELDPEARENPDLLVRSSRETRPGEK